RRRNYFIKKGLQSRFIVTFALIVVAAFLLNWYLVYYLVDKELAVELYKSHIKVRTTGEIIKPVLIKLNLIILPVVVVAASVSVMLLTRAIELPIAGFKEAVKDFEEGNFSRRFTGDVPGELAAGFNSLAETYEQTFITMGNDIEELERAVARLEEKADMAKPPVGELSGIAMSINEIRGRIREEASRFKV
ncbi:MAG: hypothetical protein ACE5GF_03980, partial [Thermodesulfobacteriota bacterium]